MNLKVIKVTSIIFFGACLFVCIPSFTQPIDLEGMDVEVLHAIKQGLDEATLTENGMYKVSIPENHLAMLAGAGAVTAGALVPLRNWQEYLLDMSDGQSLDEKLGYLFKHQDEFGLDIRYFGDIQDIYIPNYPLHHLQSYHISPMKSEVFLTTSINGSYEIILDPAYNASQRLSFIIHADEASNGMSIEAVSFSSKVRGYRAINTELITDIFNPIFSRGQSLRYDNRNTRKKIIEIITSHTVQPHVASPGAFARNARGTIVRNPSLNRRLLRRLPVVGTVAAIGISLYSLLFANDAEADLKEEVFETILTPEDFRGANEAVDLALDSYYSTQ